MNKQLLTKLFALLMCMMCAIGMMGQANASGASTVSAPISEETVNEDSLYIVLIDQFGNEVPVKLEQHNDGYYTTFTFEYYPWGEFVWDPSLSVEENEVNRPKVPFYFTINGVRYGAEIDMTKADLAYVMMNPLVADSQGNYWLHVGYSYTLGLIYKDGQYYAYVTVSYPGYAAYLVTIDQYGQKHFDALSYDNDYSVTCTFEHEPWGELIWDPNLSDEENEANRPNVPFYFIINSERYGARADMQEAALGHSNYYLNPLAANDNGYYYLPVGSSYTITLTGLSVYDYHFYVTQTTDIDEISKEKSISSVRYFNLEGQEVTEPDNVTIVVTTYDDGTKSTTKVIK